MPRASFNSQVIAESDDVRYLDGNSNFPPACLRREFIRPSPRHTVCIAEYVAFWMGLEVEDAR